MLWQFQVYTKMNDTNEFIYKIEKDTQTAKSDLRLPKGSYGEK